MATQHPDRRSDPVGDEPHATEPNPTPSGGGLLQELRRRRVVRALLAYAGAVFVVLQAADLVLDALDVPRQIFRGLVVLSLVGFPLTLVLAWLFDLTREGIRLTGGAGRGGRLVASFDSRRLMTTGFGVLVGGIALFALLRATRTEMAAAAPSERATVVAVLPFSISGGTPGVLEEGIVDLLTRNLDQVGTIRTVDPRRILRTWGREAPDGPLSVNAAQELAESTGAELIVTGSVVSVGDEVRLTAEVHTIAGERLGSARVDGPAAGFLRLVDELSISLLREVWRSARPVPGLSVEGVTSGSLDAIRAYLHGERLYRLAEWTPALASFERAVAADPEFALARFRVLSTAVWLGGAGRIEQALAEVLPRVSRLPEREQTLVRVLQLELRGARSAAIDSLGAYVGRYPDDPEGWFRLADNMFHHQQDEAGPLDRPTERDLWIFDEVLKRDSAYTVALLHPLEVAFELADTALIARYIALLPTDGSATRIYRQAEKALHSPGAVAPLVDALHLAIEAGSGAQNFDWQASRAVLEPLLRIAAVQPTRVRSDVLDRLSERLGSDGASGRGLTTRLHLMASTGRLDEYSRVLSSPATRMNLGGGTTRRLGRLPALAGFRAPAAAEEEAAAPAAERAAIALIRAIDSRDAAGARAAAASATALRSDSLARVVAGAGAGFTAVLAGDSAGGLRQVEDALRTGHFETSDLVEGLWFRWVEMAVAYAPTRARVASLVERPWPGRPLYETHRLLLLARLREAEGDRPGAAAAYGTYIEAAPPVTGEAPMGRWLEQARAGTSRVVTAG